MFEGKYINKSGNFFINEFQLSFVQIIISVFIDFQNFNVLEKIYEMM